MRRHAAGATNILVNLAVNRDALEVAVTEDDKANTRLPDKAHGTDWASSA